MLLKIYLGRNWTIACFSCIKVEHLHLKKIKQVTARPWLFGDDKLNVFKMFMIWLLLLMSIAVFDATWGKIDRLSQNHQIWSIYFGGEYQWCLPANWATNDKAFYLVWLVFEGLRLNNAWASGTVLRPFLQPESPLSSWSSVSGFKCKLLDSNSRPPYSKPCAPTTRLYTIHIWFVCFKLSIHLSYFFDSCPFPFLFHPRMFISSFSSQRREKKHPTKHAYC